MPSDDLDALAATAAKHKAAQAAMLDLQHGEGKSSSARDIATRGTLGFLKSLSGVPQAGLDLASHIPGALGRAAAAGSEGIRSRVQEIGKTLPPASTGGRIAETVGEIVPSMMMPGSPMIGGALAGATQFQPSKSEEDREAARGTGALVGAVGGKALDLVGQGVSKIVNSRQLNRDFKAIQDSVAEEDPALAASKSKIGATIEKNRATFEARGRKAIEIGDAQGPIPMHVGGADDKLREIQDKLGKSVNPSAKASKVLDNVVDLFAPEKKIPNKLTVGGRQFQLDPQGNYVTTDGVHQLPPAVAKQLLQSKGVEPSPEIKFSQLKTTIEELDNFLKGADSGNQSVKLVADARKVLQDRLEAARTPTVRRAERSAERFYNDNLKEFDKPEIKAIIEDPDPLTRVNKAFEVATGEDPKVAKTVADLIGREGQRGVTNTAIKKALDEGFDKKTGQIDAVKFLQFFEDKPSLKHFFDRQTEPMLGGIKNMLREDALRHGESPAPSLSHPSGSFGLALGLSEFIRGDITRGASMMASASLVGPAFKYLERMLQTHGGRNLLVAANRAQPGTLRSAQIFDAIARRFGRFAGAVSGQQAGQ